MTTHICSAAHKCQIEKCIHKVPHAAEKCGPAMTCYDSKLLSVCVPISNGQYRDPYTPLKSCCHCGGSGVEKSQDNLHEIGD